MHEASSRSAMLDIASLLNQGESEHHAFQLAAGDGHFNGFVPVSSKTLGILPTDHHFLGHRPYHQDPSLGLVKGEPGGGDQQSAMTMSNLTSASGEVSGGSSSGERGTTITGGGGGGSTCQQPSATTTSTSGGTQLPPLGLTVAVKRKRNLPGTPDPDAEVIALSPKTLMATNRFVCEICNKGFQRDQNLQLHRRGHNLPWKLRQRTSKEVRKRVYICPEVKCVHHDPARALGDLTGIKKHFCRKHGEKKWKCDKCSKRYAVQSDWKAHSKTCGTREYRCDCGTLFSRRDSFITHRAFCDALAEESARVNSGGHNMSALAAMQAAVGGGGPLSMMGHQQGGSPSPMSSLAVENSLMSGGSGGAVSSRPRLSLWLGSGPHASSTTPPNHHLANEQQLILSANAAEAAAASAHDLGLTISAAMDNNPSVRNAVAMASMFGSLDYDAQKQQSCAASLGMVPPSGSNGGLSYAMCNGLLTTGGQGLDMQGHELGALAGLAPDQYSGLSSWPHEQRLACPSNRYLPQYMSSSPVQLRNAPLGISTNANAYYSNGLAGVLSPLSCTNNQASTASSTASAQMSATALLQKAAQMGATASNSSLLKGLAGCDTSSRSVPWQLSPIDESGAGGISNLVQSYPLMGKDAHGAEHEARANTAEVQASRRMMMMRNHHLSGLMGNPNNDSLPHTRPASSSSSSLMGFGRGSEEADKLTRDFLGVRGLSSILHGSSAAPATSSDHRHSSAKEGMGFLQQQQQQHEHHAMLNSLKSNWDELDGHRL